MNEFVHILSDDLILIKQLIEYSLISSKFTLKGISTGGNLSMKEIISENITLLIIDENTMNGYMLGKIYQRIEELKAKDVAVIYLCKEMDETIKVLLNEFEISKVILKRENIFDVLFQMERIFIERNNEDTIRDKMIVNHLHILRIKPKVFGI